MIIVLDYQNLKVNVRLDQGNTIFEVVTKWFIEGMQILFLQELQGVRCSDSQKDLKVYFKSEILIFRKMTKNLMKKSVQGQVLMKFKLQ